MSKYLGRSWRPAQLGEDGRLTGEDEVCARLLAFDEAIAIARDAKACWRALEALAAAVAGCKLFTVTLVDDAASLARRVYSNDEAAYPVSGTKPIQHDEWYSLVLQRHQLFVSNTIEDIAKHFPDYQLIQSLGCGSVVNLPVVLGGELVATVNMLDAEHHYNSDRVSLITTYLSMPSKLALLAARQFDYSAHLAMSS